MNRQTYIYPHHNNFFVFIIIFGGLAIATLPYKEGYKAFSSVDYWVAPGISLLLLLAIVLYIKSQRVCLSDDYIGYRRLTLAGIKETKIKVSDLDYWYSQLLMLVGVPKGANAPNMPPRLFEDTSKVLQIPAMFEPYTDQIREFLVGKGISEKTDHLE